MRIKSCGGVILVVLATGVPTVAADKPTALSREQVEKFRTKNYNAPKVVFDSSKVRVFSAKKRNKPRLVVMTATDALVDGGARSRGTLSVTARQDPSPNTTGMTLLEVSYETPRANNGSNTNGMLWIVRDDGTIACKVRGSSGTSITGCGSSGWTSIEVSTRSTPSGVTLDVLYEDSGNYSTPDGRGGCLRRSPVRSSRLESWLIPEQGPCKKGTPP